MGKATKLVTIIVTEREMLDLPVFKKMSEQGHNIVALDSLLPAVLPTLPGSVEAPPFALVMGPRAHLLLPGMEACVPVALKKARVELYSPEEETLP